MYSNSTPICNAIARGEVGALKDLLLNDPTLVSTPYVNDVHRELPIFHALRHQRCSIVQLLIESGSPLDVKDRSGETPFHKAARNDDALTIKLLVEAGSTFIDIPSFLHRGTPLFIAACYGNANVIETLVLLGSTALDTPCSEGNTPMSIAAMTGRSVIVELLVRLGSQVIDLRNSHGFTPFEITISCCAYSTMNVLIALGANYKDADTQRIHASSYVKALIECGVSENKASEVRYRVYFCQSLVGRLLFELERKKPLWLERTVGRAS